MMVQSFEMVQGINYFEVTFSRIIPKTWTYLLFVCVCLTSFLKPILLVPVLVICWRILDKYPLQETMILIKDVGIQLTIHNASGKVKKFATTLDNIKHVFINEVLTCCDVKFVLQVLHKVDKEEYLKVPFKSWSTSLETLLLIQGGIRTFLQPPTFEKMKETNQVSVKDNSNADKISRYNLRPRNQKPK